MNAPDETSPLPTSFASFYEARQWIIERTGHGYKGTDPQLLVDAERLGVLEPVREILGRYAHVAEAATARSVELVDERPPELEPPLVEFPEGWRTAKPGTQALPGYPISDIWNGYEAPQYLVKRILAPGEVTVLFGMSGHFKSVVAIDLALSTAVGADYHGLKTHKAGVLYVAGEGHAGIKKRSRAWMLDRGMDEESEQPAMYVTNMAANLSGRPGELQATVEAASAELDHEIRLVVIDTLAANFGDGDENHASEMQLAISNARSAAPQAGILLVHHMGHGQDERERGSYALIAAADCRIKASYDEGTRTVEMAWRKLKDDEMPQPMLFTWRAVKLGWMDGDGDELSSVVLDQLDAQNVPKAPPAQRPKGFGKNQEMAIKTLRALIAKARKNLKDRGEDPAKACILTAGWRAELDRKGIPRNRINDLQRDLQERNVIAFDGPHVNFMEDEKTTIQNAEMPTGTRPEPDAKPDAKNDRNAATGIYIHKSGLQNRSAGTPEPQPSDADAVRSGQEASLADPLAGLAPSGTSSTAVTRLQTEQTPNETHDSTNDLDELAATLGTQRQPFESDEELDSRLRSLHQPLNP